MNFIDSSQQTFKESILPLHVNCGNALADALADVFWIVTGDNRIARARMIELTIGHITTPSFTRRFAKRAGDELRNNPLLLVPLRVRHGIGRSGRPTLRRHRPARPGDPVDTDRYWIARSSRAMTPQVSFIGKRSAAAAQRRAGDAADLDFVAERIARHDAGRTAVAHVAGSQRIEFRLYFLLVEIGDGVADVVDHRL
jgi:hypothetical protein